MTMLLWATSPLPTALSLATIVQFTSSKVDIGDVSYGDSDGIAMLEIPYTCVPDSAANAEFDLVFT